MAQQPSDYQYLKTPQRVVVISDLHLGGRPPATGVDTRMCGDEGAKDLEKFVAWVRTQHSEHWPIHLIVNGDILDFLAERNDRGGYDAFTPSESEAHRKMCRILGDPCYAPVFVQLAEFVKLKGARLTLLMGNHDVELSLPAVRRELLERLGPGSVEFIADNEGLALGCLLVEHGNRYDGWNYLKHNQLRACRSLMTRADPRAHFDPPPGSELVVKVLNELKPLFPFIDLLKPEDEVTLRIVRMLAPPSRKKLRLMLRAARGYVQPLLGKLRQGATGGVGENAAAPTSDPRSSLAANSPPEEETEAPPVTRALNLSLIRIDETEMLLSSLDGDLSSGDDASGGGILRSEPDVRPCSVACRSTSRSASFLRASMS